MNPIEVLYSWQSVVLAVAVAGLVQAIKTTLDTALGAAPTGRKPETTDRRAARATGREIRKQSALLTRILLPLLPIIIGAVLAMLVPLRPDILTEYAKTHGENVGIYGLWGAAMGQFADYIYQQAKRNIRPGSGTGTGSIPPPSNPPSDPPPSDPPPSDPPPSDPSPAA